MSTWHIPDWKVFKLPTVTWETPGQSLGRQPGLLGWAHAKEKENLLLVRLGDL